MLLLSTVICRGVVEKPVVIGLTFKATKVELLKYLAKFEGADYSREYARLEQLIFMKEDLAKLLSNMPFTPSESVEILVKRDGELTRIPCLFMKGNVNQLDIKTAAGKYARFDWSDLPTETILVVMEYYLGLKIAAIKARMFGKNKKMVLADFALRMALLADWNGLSEKSNSYAEVVIKYQPSYKQYVNKFLAK